MCIRDRYIPSFALPIYKTTCHAKPYHLCCCCFCCCCGWCCCYCTTYCWLVLLGVFFFFFQLSCESYMVMDVVIQNPQKSSRYDQGVTMRKNMRVVTPRCAAAAVVFAVVLRRPTKEYTHRYSMMHRRLNTAGIEVAPDYHQLLVPVFFCGYHAVSSFSVSAATRSAYSSKYIYIMIRT